MVSGSNARRTSATKAPPYEVLSFLRRRVPTEKRRGRGGFTRRWIDDTTEELPPKEIRREKGGSSQRRGIYLD
jgi:hypothetical protein